MSIFESLGEWTIRATCARRDPRMWEYPDHHPDSADTYRLRTAASICHTCPVRSDCADSVPAVRPVGQVWAGTAYNNEGIPLSTCDTCRLPCVITKLHDDGRIWCSEYCRARAGHGVGNPTPYRLQFPIWDGPGQDGCRKRAIGRLQSELRRNGMLATGTGRWLTRQPTPGELERWAGSSRPVVRTLEYRTHVMPRSTP
jgi:hypothetical protein